MSKYKRYLLSTPDMGVYLGSCMGMGFWSELDPVGQDMAAVFETPEQINEYVHTWEDQPKKWDIEEIMTVDPHYASIAEIEAIGRMGWNPDTVSGQVR